MAYKRVPRCPIDKTVQKGMVQSTKEEVTYHCPKCDTYWHFAYVYEWNLSAARKVWSLKYVRDDFGRKYEYVQLH